MPQKPHQNQRRQTKSAQTACPVCGEEVRAENVAANPLFPFCSNRCKMIDLGKWFAGDYSISREIEPGDEEPDE